MVRSTWLTTLILLLGIVGSLAFVAWTLVIPDPASGLLGSVNLQTVLISSNLPGLQRYIPTELRTLKPAIRTTEDTEGASIERSNCTVVLQNMELRHRENEGPWMYSKGDEPFVDNDDKRNSVRAYTSITWNPDGVSDGSCDGVGNGRPSNGYLDPFHYTLNLSRSEDFPNIRIILKDLVLLSFAHINTVDENEPWNTTGQAGDTRSYVNGTFRIRNEEKVLLSVASVRWMQNTSYPYPVGATTSDSPEISAYFYGDIIEYGSDEKWVRAVDPFGTGYVLGVVTAAALSSPELSSSACSGMASYWVSVRGFPDFNRGTENSVVIVNNTANSGAKVGAYGGSNTQAIEQAKNLANFSVTVVTTTVTAVVAGAVGTTAVAVTVPAVSVSSVSMPGNGVARMIKSAAFLAKIQEIRGFHTDAMVEYGKGMSPFLAKFSFPFGSQDQASSVGRWISGSYLPKAWRVALEDSNEDDLPVIDRQEEEDDEPSVTDDVFKGCAFTTTVVVLAFLSIHGLIWAFTRKKPLAHQVAPHAWMVYIFSIVMSYVYTAAVLNSFQYVRSHLGTGTGKTGLFLIAAVQLLLIGIGFLVFFITIMFLAVRRMRARNVKWIPRRMHPDPSIRSSVVILGEYEANDDNVFHRVFECYYSGLAGPRVWLAGIEMVVTFLDAMVTAIVWNEFTCVALLISIHGSLFVLFLTLGPFVDTIEGRLVTGVLFIDVLMLFLELLTALGSYNTAERMEGIAMAAGLCSIILGVLITIYCDLIPISLTIWKWIRKHAVAFLQRAKVLVAMESDADSEWSALTTSERSHGSHISSSSSHENDGDRDREHVLNIGALRWRSQKKQFGQAWKPAYEDGKAMFTDRAPSSASLTPRNRMIPPEALPDVSVVAEPPQWSRSDQVIDNVWDLGADMGDMVDDEEDFDQGEE